MRISIHHYYRLAEASNLDVLLPDGVCPKNASVPIEWRCRRCGKIHVRSYSETKNRRGHACHCTSSLTLTEESYHNLAKIHGIRWTPQGFLPTNSKTLTQWTDADGNVFEATYHQLNPSSPIPKRYHVHLRTGGDDVV